MGRKQRGRLVNGILLLDKPMGLTSNAALQRVKRLFDARKAGHTGSLDPLATGLLPLCFGEATKISTYLLDADKQYWVRIKLGEKTATADAEGEIIETAEVPALDAGTVNAVLDTFLGKQMQVPPMYSAVKHEGKRLYELAREGKQVERKAREITLRELNLGEMTGDSIELTIRCTKGTYVRTLAEDIAVKLGTVGHVAALRRTGVGGLSADNMLSMEQIEVLAESGTEALDAQLLDFDAALEHWPSVSVTADGEFYLQRGEALQIGGAPTEGWVRVHGVAGKLLALAEILDDGRVAPRRIIKQ